MSSQLETEVVIFAKINEPKGLLEAVYSECHNQYSLVQNSKGKLRLRESWDSDQNTSIDSYRRKMTVKLSTSQDSAVPQYEEHDVTVSKELFEVMKSLALNVVRKTRYIFNSKNVTIKVDGYDDIILPMVKYEVDVFKDGQNASKPWCKIEVEFDKMLEEIKERFPDIKDTSVKVAISHLPFKPSDWFMPESMDDAQKKIVDDLFNQ